MNLSDAFSKNSESQKTKSLIGFKAFDNLQKLKIKKPHTLRMRFFYILKFKNDL